MAREDPQLKLRLTDEMKAKVTKLARENGRSVNAEIVHRIESSLNYSPEKVQELKWETEEQSAEIAELEDLVAEKEAEILRLKEQVTFYRGINESLSKTVKIFVERMTNLESERTSILDQIMQSSRGDEDK